MSAPTEFSFSHEPEPHRARTRAILQKYPHIRELVGRKNPWTFVIIVLCVLFQFALAWRLRQAGWGEVLLAAYLVGAFASHILFVCIHEAAHFLIFKGTRANLYAALLANLPTLVPTALTFRHFHMKHHSFQGVEELDADLPSRWEARLIGCYAPGKALWLLGFPIFQSLRTPRVREVKPFDGWSLANFAIQIALVPLLAHFWGGRALLYLLASFWFSVGLHPLGARWVQEHWLVLDPVQETYSYYGGLNWLNMNVGYHNEHHDFPSVPWHLLPQIKATAPEFYDSLRSHNSLVGLFLRFLFDQEISLFCRMTRQRWALNPGESGICSKVETEF